jgi:glycosyltransferase involved in cell wall biosynthesis
MNSSQISRNHKRHCMVVHAYYPLGETRVQREAEALLKHGYEVDVICLRYEGEPPRDDFKGVRIHRLPVQRHKSSGLFVQLLEYLAFLFGAMFKVSWLYLKRHYNTIQVHNPPDFLVFAAWIPRLFGTRIILDLHDLMTEFYMGRFHRDIDSLPVRMIRLQERLSCRFAHHVITVSHHWRQALADRGVKEEKISVVMNVADDAVFRPPENQPRQTATDQSLHLIYHGVVTQRYGLDLVLQAMARLRQDAPNVYFTILGGGDHMDTLVRMADELALNDRVTFHREFRPAEELPEIILAADAGVVPYRNDPFTDGLVPTKLMEYAALGLPAIAARTTAIARYFEDTGVELFTPGSVDDLARCLELFYNDQGRLARLAERTKEFNRRYNWPSQSAEYVRLVDHLGQPGTG